MNPLLIPRERIVAAPPPPVEDTPTSNGKRRRPRDAVRAWEGNHAVRLYRSLQFLVGPLLRGLFRTHREGIRTIPKKGPVILVTNHVSNIDPVLVVSSMHRPIFHLGKHTLFRSRFGSWFFQTLGGQIPVNREARGSNEAAIAAAVKALNRGYAFGIYPEGYRSPDGRLRRGRPGVGRLAYLTGAPCFPVAIDGTFRAWPKNRKMPRLFVPTRVLVGLPRVYPKDPRLAEDRRACQRVADDLMSDLARLLGQPYDPETAPPPTPEKTSAANV